MDAGRAREIAAGALSRTGADRDAWLRDACGGDAALRALVDALLAASGRDGGFMDAPTQDHGDGALAATAASDAGSEQPGERIGPYTLLQLLGEGGFGSVFMAEQTEPVRRRVALKIIKLGMDTRQVVARFEQERQALALMDHPNIARVLDAGATTAGRPYFVMELVKGDPITVHCDRNSLSIADRLQLFAQVCQAVQHAHAKGVIHRDIKPSNVLVFTQDGQPTAKVIDFGIAKATSARLTERTFFTEHRSLIGTPEYMSPEQAEGSLDIDTSTDVYSLGVLLYELLTGSTPFSGAELRSAAYAEIQRIIREVDPPRPSTRLSQSTATIADVAARRHTEPRRLGTIVRGELDWIVMKALEKDRRRRYETASALALDVRRHLAGEPVTAAPPSVGYLARKFATRHRGPVVAGGAVAAALLVGAVGFAWQASVAREQRDEAEAARAEAKARADELAQVAEFQAGMLAGIDAYATGERLMAGMRAKFAADLEADGVPEDERAEAVRRFADDLSRVNATDTAATMIDGTILQPAIVSIDATFAEQPLVDARLRATLAESYRSLGLYDAAHDQIQEALATRERLLGADDPDTLRARSDLAVLLEAQGRLEEAEGPSRAAFEGRRRVLGPDDPQTLASMSNLGNLLRAAGRFDEAEPLLEDAVARYRRVLGDACRDTLVAVNQLGFLYIMQGRIAEAEPLWREAAEKGRAALGEDDVDVLVWNHNMGGLLQSQGKYADAEPYYRDSLARHRRIRGEEHPDTVNALESYGTVLVRQGRYAEAEPVYREALDAWTRLLGEAHPSTLNCMSNLGDLLFRQGRAEEGAAMQARALEIRRRTLGDDHPNTIVSMGMLAQTLVRAERAAEGEPLFREALDRARATLGPDHPSTLVIMTNFGNVLMTAGRTAEAGPLLRESLDARRRVSGATHPETLVALSNVGRLAELEGDVAEAEAIHREALAAFRSVLGDAHPNTLNAIVNLASVLRTTDRAAEAEPLYREALAGFEGLHGAAHARTASCRLGLGLALAQADRFAEAETALLEAERVLATADGVPAGRHQECVDALAALYDAWHAVEPDAGHAAQATEWRARRAGE